MCSTKTKRKIFNGYQERCFFKVVFLYDDEIYPSDMIHATSVEAILEEMHRGEMIGDASLDSIDDVPANKIKEELLAIGNDGTFFDPV